MDLEASLDVILGVFFEFFLAKIVVAISVQKKSRENRSKDVKSGKLHHYEAILLFLGCQR